MPPSKRRKLSPAEDEPESEAPASLEPTTAAEPPTSSDPGPAQDQPSNSEEDTKPSPAPAEPPAASDSTATESPSVAPPPSNPSADRLARFAALKSRATQSARSNLAEAKAEANRAAMDPTLLANLSRRANIAQHNLLKADTEEGEGAGAFERKRAWDYTIEESERWDARLARKREARDNNAFQDYSAEAGKIYDRQMRELEKAGTRAAYDADKAAVAQAGGLEVVELASGELVAIDRDGRFFAHADSTGFTEQKPAKENVDRLVADIAKAEEVRLRKRRERRGGDGDGDVTYINEKNKQFNMKLARFYDRYTEDIRGSFERGTAL